MNIPIPKNMKSPTVVIIGQGTMSGDDKSNKIHEKRMDYLEKKLDDQYKRTVDGKSYIRDMESLQKSFIKKLDKFVSQSKQNISSQNDRLVEALKKTVNQKIKVIKESAGDSNNNEEIKTFLKKFDSLEDAIGKITLKTGNIKVTPRINLDSSFEKFFARMEKLIKESRPRMYPSPS